jgi:hypothetical protein
MTPSSPAAQLAGQTAAKSSAPLLAHTFSIPEIIHLAFGLPVTFTKTELLEALSKYPLEHFVSTAFRKHRKGHKLNTKSIPIDSLLRFTDKPLRKPLLQCVPKQLKKKSTLLFDLLLQYTGVRTDRVVGGPMQIARHVLQLLSEHPQELVDEFYFQLVKQMLGNPDQVFLLRTWDLFLLLASVFPPSEMSYLWLLAHVARNTADPEPRINCVAAFVFIRLETRHYCQKIVDWAADKRFIERNAEEITAGRACFGVLLYEMMWCQKNEYQQLPIPYVLYYMIELLKERNALRTNGIFRQPGTEGVVQEILNDVNEDMTVMSKGDVNVVGTLFKIWLRELPNPVIPVEQCEIFQQMVDQNKVLGFVEKLPQVHQLTLIYVIGFLQELCRSSEHTGMDKADLAMVFGPCFVNPIKVAPNEPEKIQKLTELSVVLCSRLIEARDPSVVYPLTQAYLPKFSAIRKPTGKPPP